MTNLRESLRAIPDSRVVLSSTKGAVTAEELLSCWPTAWIDGLRGRNVLLFLGRLDYALPALVHLDGVAERILLASRSIAPQTVLNLARQADCDHVLTDEEPIPTIPPDWQQYILPQELTASKAPALTGNSHSGRRSTQWLLPTSGTTGQPKLVSHSFRSLTRTTKVNLQRGAECRWGLLYDYARFAGLQVVLQSLLSGALLIAPQLTDPLESQIRQLIENGCTHLSATPTLWRKILMVVGSERWDLRQITLGGEIADQRVLSALRLRFPQARIAHIYASTEAGVGFSVADGREGFPADYLQDAPGGIELRVRSGKLYIRNPSVKATYVGTDDSFVDEEGFVNTGDLVDRRGERYVFLGRETGIINVGGNKVHPEEVEQVLLSHPAVWQAKVSAKRNPITGSLVVAEVVPLDDPADSEVLRDSIAQHCRGQLDRFKVPALIHFVKEFACSATGKLARDND